MKYFATALAILSMAAAPMAIATAQTPPPPPSQAQSQPAHSTGTPQGVLVGSDSLVGSTVRDSGGRDVGKVNRLMIDPADGKISSLIIATGGTLGVGGNTISV